MIFDMGAILQRLCGLSFKVLPQSEYDNLEVKEKNTIYFTYEG